MEELKNYIDGELVSAQSGNTLPNWSPATGEIYSRLPDSDAQDVQRAVDAATRAFASWSALSATERSQYLRKIARGIEARKSELALAEAIDTGKPSSVTASLDIPRSSANFDFFADAITQFSSEAHVTDRTAVNYTNRHALGVVGCISPWNLPLYLLSWKIAPALAAGNCVVAKPSEVTPMTAYLLSQICRDIGLPPGVLNIVHGLGAKVGGAITGHAGIKAVSFTGSTQTGESIARLAAPAFKKLSLEMGGKNATVVFEDCNLDEAVAGAARAAFSNQGQICLCGSRILVQRTIYERFKNALVHRAQTLKIGDPLVINTDQGALTSQAHFEKVMSYVALAQKEGGKVLCGGNRAHVGGRCRNGWFIEPTLLEGLAPECRTNQEEIFGPVATLIPFDTEDQALAWANGTRYGLAASIWTSDVTRAHRFAGRLQTGVVWINCWMLRDLRTPFGGMKDSGVGREGGLDALRFFTEAQNVCVKI
ncbi:MAG: aldehyde dehydrogenase [Deltaproteobacteria bacterium]|nr:aldehyde dehydrogenase [Deltaproteobacteria bacterium]